MNKTNHIDSKNGVGLLLSPSKAAPVSGLTDIFFVKLRRSC